MSQRSITFCAIYELSSRSGWKYKLEWLLWSCFHICSCGCHPCLALIVYFNLPSAERRLIVGNFRVSRPKFTDWSLKESQNNRLEQVNWINDMEEVDCWKNWTTKGWGTQVLRQRVSGRWEAPWIMIFGFKMKHHRFIIVVWGRVSDLRLDQTL